MAVALGGVSHAGVYPPGVHLIHVTLLILHESSTLQELGLMVKTGTAR